MDIQTGKWFVFDGYEIKEITPSAERYHLGTVKFISDKENSHARVYDPLTFGGVERATYGKSSYQPRKTEGEEWPPHLALARLNTSSEESILNFVSTYGLLGLFLLGDDRIFYKWGSVDYHKNALKFAFDNHTLFSKDYTKATINYLEPLATFIAATKEFQSAVKLLMAIKEKQPEEYKGELWHKFTSIANPYLAQIQLMSAYDKNADSPTIMYNFKTLISCCYFRLLQDMRGGSLKTCAFKKCSLPFLARNAEDNYCSKECRHRGTMSMLAIRRVKNGLKDMEQRGDISKALRWSAGKKAQKLYDGGVRKYEDLHKKVLSFIKKEKREG